jgi:hypothetical protein
MPSSNFACDGVTFMSSWMSDDRSMPPVSAVWTTAPRVGAMTMPELATSSSSMRTRP